MSGATEAKVKALYFAWVRERVGRADEELDPPPSVTTVGDLVAWLSERGESLRPRVRQARGRSRRARSGSRPQRRSDRGREGSGVLPSDDRRLKAMASVRVQKDDFDPGAEAEALARGRTDVGAVVSFVGYCRDEGGSLGALELEHYPGMAEDEIVRVAREAEARWPLIGATVIHRYGRIAPGGRIVLVAVAAKHRGAAFAAAEMLMDYLKTRAPFWKRAIRPTATSRAGSRRREDDRSAARWSANRR